MRSASMNLLIDLLGRRRPAGISKYARWLRVMLRTGQRARRVAQLRCPNSRRVETSAQMTALRVFDEAPSRSCRRCRKRSQRTRGRVESRSRLPTCAAFKAVPKARARTAADRRNVRARKATRFASRASGYSIQTVVVYRQFDRFASAAEHRPETRHRGSSNCARRDDGRG